MRRPFDIVALAKRINRRREEFNRLHDRRARITSAMSKILENDHEYSPYRPRVANRRQPPAVNPTIATLVAIAANLETTVGDLLGERAFRIATSDRRRLKVFLDYLWDLFALDELS